MASIFAINEYGGDVYIDKAIVAILSSGFNETRFDDPIIPIIIIVNVR